VNKLLTSLVFFAVFSTSSFAQGPTWTTSTIQAYNGYDYELWSEDNTGTTSMTLTGDNGQGANAKGGTFTCSWQNSLNILFRSGKKWGMTGGPTPNSVGNIKIDFDATWSSNDGARMLGVYGWAFYPSGSIPTQDESGVTRQYSDQIEYYIIQDRGGYNPATGGDAAGGGKKKGSATIDGIEYDFYVADRINRWALTGNGDVTFKQYFSVPKNTSSHRQRGIISVSKHFEEWEKVGMKMMDCRLYEVAMKVESYTDSRNGTGTATLNRNLLIIGEAPEGYFTITANASPLSAGQVTREPYLVFYPAGTSVTLTATPASGWKFDNWDGDICETNPTTTVTMNANKNIIAKYSLVAGSDIDLVKDGNFPGTSLNTANWSITSGATANVSGNKATINIANLGTNEWEPQLTQKNIELIEGMSYILTFTASAAAARSINVMFQESGGEYTTYKAQDFELSATPKEYTLKLDMPSNDANVQLAFNFNYGESNKTSSITLSNISLRYDIPAGSSSSGAPVCNGGGSSSSIGDNTPILISPLSRVEFRVSSMNNKSLLVESNSKATVYLYNIKGNVAQKIEAPAGSSIVKLSVPNGIYIVKNARTKQTQRIMVK